MQLLAVRLRILALVVVSALALAPREARAEPEPLNASLMSATATLLPVAVGTGLLLTGRKDTEGVRLASAFSCISVGLAFGPWSGQLYAGSGVDGTVTMLLRTLTTGATMTGLGLTLRGGEDVKAPATALMVLGGIPTAILAGYDIIDAADTAREARIRPAADLATPEDLYSIAVCGAFPCDEATLAISAAQ